jgi:hypothetical protein
VPEATFSWLPLAEPKSTARTLVKFLPVTVTLVPPAVVPDAGDTFDTDGRAGRSALAVTAAWAGGPAADTAAPINPRLAIPTPVRRAST